MSRELGNQSAVYDFWQIIDHWTSAIFSFESKRTETFDNKNNFFLSIVVTEMISCPPTPVIRPSLIAVRFSLSDSGQSEIQLVLQLTDLQLSSNTYSIHQQAAMNAHSRVDLVHIWGVFLMKHHFMLPKSTQVFYFFPPDYFIHSKCVESDYLFAERLLLCWGWIQANVNHTSGP